MQEVDNRTIRNAQAIFNIEDRTKKLELIADWRDELRRKLGNACNDVWSPAPDLEHLRTEVERFKLASKGTRQ
jgi:hypothetical protein